jgi:hypothetical protein
VCSLRNLEEIFGGKGFVLEETHRKRDSAALAQLMGSSDVHTDRVEAQLLSLMSEGVGGEGGEEEETALGGAAGRRGNDDDASKEIRYERAGILKRDSGWGGREPSARLRCRGEPGDQGWASPACLPAFFPLRCRWFDADAVGAAPGPRRGACTCASRRCSTRRSSSCSSVLWRCDASGRQRRSA